MRAYEAAEMTADSAAAVTFAEVPLEWLSAMVSRNAWAVRLRAGTCHSSVV
jgi:hypothetical protein